MQKTPILSFLLITAGMLLSFVLHAQLPQLQWSNHYGGRDVDIAYAIKFTNDGGTILAGYTDSKSGDVSVQPNRDYWDMWITKLDHCGNLQWEKSFGGTSYESARDVVQTSDGGYLVVGETNSTDGNVVAGYGGTRDVWVLKLDANGNLQWQKRYGGSGLDIGSHVEITSDGGYLIAGSTSSNDGDVKGNHGTGGYTDGLLLKISSDGTLQWSKCFGGSKNEELLDIEFVNGKVFLAGYANSTDGDIPPSQKNYDVWLLALDNNGNKIFSKVYGGSQNDVAYSMCLGNDGTLTLAGYTTSTDGLVSGAKGSQDFWVINLTQNGNFNWQKTLGGTDAEYANVVVTDKDGGYLVGGISYSNDGDITNAKGDGDFWVVKLNSKGNKLWSESYGGGSSDHLRSIIFKPSLNEYYLAGDSESGDGDFNTSKGETDFALIKFKQPDSLITDSVVCTLNGFVSPIDTIRDACGYDSVYLKYKPVLLNNPFDSIKRRADTILVGQSITLHASGNGIITWNHHNTLSCTNCKDPVATPLNTTTYVVVNSSPNGCQQTAQFTVVVLKEAMVMMPTAFSPNGDGLNDQYGPIGRVPDGYTLLLYNRVGELIFKSNSISNQWNGYYKGKPQPVDAYVYLINYRDLENKEHQLKGTFMLIR